MCSSLLPSSHVWAYSSLLVILLVLVQKPPRFMASEHDTRSAEGDSNVVTNTESVSVQQKRKALRRPSPPPPLKRTIFFVFTGFLFWFLLAKLFGLGQQKQPEIVYAQRCVVSVLLADILLILGTQILERIQV